MHRQEIFRAAEPDGVLFPPVIVPPGALLLFDCDDVDFVRDGGAEDLSMLTYDNASWRISLFPTRNIVNLMFLIESFPENNKND